MMTEPRSFKSIILYTLFALSLCTRGILGGAIGAVSGEVMAEEAGVSLGIMLCTAGVGTPAVAGAQAGIGISAQASMQVTLQAAAMTALKTQALTHLIRSGGDPVHTIKSLASAQTLQNIVVSVAAAGLVQGLNSSLDLNLKLTPEQLKGASFMEHMQTAAFKGAINTSLNATAAAMQDQDVKGTIKSGIIYAAIDGVAQYTAGRIGELYKPTVVSNAAVSGDGDDGSQPNTLDPGSKTGRVSGPSVRNQGAGSSFSSNIATSSISGSAPGASASGPLTIPSIDYLTHKALHGVLGATTGLALSATQGENLARGLLGGAIGAISAEVMAEAAMNHLVTTPSLSYNDALTYSSAVGKMGGALMAFGLNQDVNAGIYSAVNAVDYNYLNHFKELCMSPDDYADFCLEEELLDAEADESAAGQLRNKYAKPIGTFMHENVLDGCMALIKGR